MAIINLGERLSKSVDKLAWGWELRGLKPKPAFNCNWSQELLFLSPHPKKSTVFSVKKSLELNLSFPKKIIVKRITGTTELVKRKNQRFAMLA